MIHFVHLPLQAVAKSDEIEHVVIFIQRSFDFRFNPPIVSVDSLANVSIERNEMRRAKDKRVFGDSHTPGFGGRLFHESVLR